eukprot:756811-Hanusia_phi.AAC.5
MRQKPSDLDLFIGSVKLEDGQLELSKTINTGYCASSSVLVLDGSDLCHLSFILGNPPFGRRFSPVLTGAKPPYLMTYLKDYCVAPGTVFRAEYTQTAAEYKMKNPEMDVSKLGPIPEADTLVARARDTVGWQVVKKILTVDQVLDPDFYISSLEQVSPQIEDLTFVSCVSSQQAPRLVADFFAFAEDEDGPFVGRDRLTEIGQSSSQSFVGHAISNPQDVTKSIVMV